MSGFGPVKDPWGASRNGRTPSEAVGQWVSANDNCWSFVDLIERRLRWAGLSSSGPGELKSVVRYLGIEATMLWRSPSRRRCSPARLVMTAELAGSLTSQQQPINLAAEIAG